MISLWWVVVSTVFLACLNVVSLWIVNGWINDLHQWVTDRFIDVDEQLNNKIDKTRRK